MSNAASPKSTYTFVGAPGFVSSPMGSTVEVNTLPGRGLWIKGVAKFTNDEVVLMKYYQYMHYVYTFPVALMAFLAIGLMYFMPGSPLVFLSFLAAAALSVFCFNLLTDHKAKMRKYLSNNLWNRFEYFKKVASDEDLQTALDQVSYNRGEMLSEVEEYEASFKVMFGVKFALHDGETTYTVQTLLSRLIDLSDKGQYAEDLQGSRIDAVANLYEVCINTYDRYVQADAPRDQGMD